MSFRLKFLTGLKGVPVSFPLQISSLRRDQNRIAQTIAVAAAQIAASFDSMSVVQGQPQGNALAIIFTDYLGLSSR
jgi:hypothetical protein